MSNVIECESDGRVAPVTVNRPGKRSALNCVLRTLGGRRRRAVREAPLPLANGPAVFVAPALAPCAVR